MNFLSFASICTSSVFVPFCPTALLSPCFIAPAEQRTSCLLWCQLQPYSATHSVQGATGVNKVWCEVLGSSSPFHTANCSKRLLQSQPPTSRERRDFGGLLGAIAICRWGCHALSPHPSPHHLVPRCSAGTHTACRAADLDEAQAFFISNLLFCFSSNHRTHQQDCAPQPGSAARGAAAAGAGREVMGGGAELAGR